VRFKARRRALVLCGLMAVIFTGFSGRLIYLQIVKHDEYTAIAAQKHSMLQIIPAQRGMIVDRNGEILAASIPVRKVIVDGSHVKNPAALANVAAPFLKMPEDALLKELQTDSKHKILVQELPEDTALALQAAMDKKNLHGIYFYQNSIRTYPNGSMLSHVLGYLARKDPNDVDVIGVDGIERSMQEYLAGEDGFRHIERDRTGREIVVYRGQEQAARQGSNVQLTIDMGLQAILEGELEKAYQKYTPENVIGIIVRPKTGEILAMANQPTFNPNDLRVLKPEQMKNRAIMDMVEPGSTFKIVVASGALNEGVVNASSSINCEGGHFAYGGRILRDHAAYGPLSVHDILMKSSNIGSAKMGLMMGNEKFYEYVRRYGFGEKTGITLPGEISGLVHPPSRWDKLTITRMPMGQAVAVTPLQITMAMSVIANGGKLMRPHIVRSVKDQDGKEIATVEPEVVRDVVPEKVASFVSNALSSVVSDQGTAKAARVDGFTVAGKTGTAQKIDPKGGYAEGKYVVSFVGYLPVEDPQFVCLIMVNDAKLPPHENFGGSVAGPIFATVAGKAACYLNLTPTYKAETALAQLPVNTEEMRQ